LVNASCCLPATIFADRHADPAVTGLDELWTFARPAQALACGFGKIIYFAPDLKGHDAIVIESAITFALPVPALCFTKGHGRLLGSPRQRLTKLKWDY
jgi:hypothetical protein